MKRYVRRVPIRASSDRRFSNREADLSDLETMLVDYTGCSDDALDLVERINGRSLKTLCDILYVYTGYRDFEQFMDAEDID